jgi:probable rRNA maturation factor
MELASRITYTCEDIDFMFSDEDKTSKWILQVAENESKEIGFIDYIFCSDEYLIQINKEHLNHDTFTDIITFNYNEGNQISADILISIDRIKENAGTFAVSFSEELHRVIIHGVLHLIGFNDKTDKDQELMTEKENDSLKIYNNL